MIIKTKIITAKRNAEGEESLEHKVNKFIQEEQVHVIDITPCDRLGAYDPEIERMLIAYKVPPGR